MAKSAFYAASRDLLKQPRTVAVVSEGRLPRPERLTGINRVAVCKKPNSRLTGHKY